MENKEKDFKIMRVAYCSTVGYLFHRVQFTGNEAVQVVLRFSSKSPPVFVKGKPHWTLGCGVASLGYGAQLVIIVGGSW